MPTKRELEAELYAVRAEVARLRARESTPVLSPSIAVERLREVCHGEQEVFAVLLLDARNRPLHCAAVHVGTLSDVPVHPREVFREAVRYCAHAIIVAHNHPSQDASPSSADIELTNRLVEAGKLLGIPVLDHLVLTDTDHTSLRDIGLVNT